MRTTHRLATLSLSVVAVGSLLGGTAAAQATADAGSWGGTASAEALTIKLFGQTLTTSAATAEVRAALAKATATEALTPLLTGDVSAETTTVGTKTAAPQTCTGSELTAIPLLKRVDLTCGSATATLSATGGSARGLGAGAVLEPSVANLLGALQLQQPAQGATNQLVEALNPLVEGLTGTPLGPLVTGTTDTVGEILNDVLSLQSTARIVIAPALAQVTAEGNEVVSEAHAQGLRIELLPMDGTNATGNLLPGDLTAGEPLITITVGEAKARKKVAKDGSSTATSEAQSALVTVEFGTNALLSALGLPTDKIEVPVGQSFCIPGLVGTPLETCISVAAAGVGADGNPFAGGTSIQLLKGLNGGIDLTTGRAGSTGQAGASAAPAAPASAPVGQLPSTGGPATLPLVGGAMLAFAAAGRRLVAGRR